MSAQKTGTQVSSEWSYIFDTSDLPDKGEALKISPDADELQALKKRLDVLDLKDLSADIAVTPTRQGTVHVQGIITATVVQACVTTLEPVTTKIKDDFDAYYADAQSIVSFAKAQQEKKAEGKERPILSEADDPEALVDGKIDLGELVTQFLSLALPTFPHAPGVEPVGDDPADPKVASEDKPTNPFAALKEWKDRQR